MPATDNSSVQITINVVDANSGEVVSRVVKSLNSLGNAGAGSGGKLKQSLGEAGEAGTQSAKKIAAGMDHAGGHTMSALDNVRLMRDDLGIRIPRAMEVVISRSKVAMAAIGGIGAGFVALGVAELVLHVGEEVYHLYQRLTDVNAEMRKFAAGLGQASNQELFSNSSLETTASLLKQVNDQVAALQAQRSQAGVGQDNSGSIMQWFNKGALLLASQHAADASQQQQLAAMSAGTPTFTPGKGVELAKLSADQEVLRRRSDLLERQKKLQEKQDALTQAGAGIEGRAATEAKRRAAKDLAAAQYDAQQANEQLVRAASIRARLLEDQQGKLPVDQRTKIYEVSSEAGTADRQRAERNADVDAFATNSKQSRTERNEATHARAEAGMSGEEGEKLYLDQKEEARRQLKERAAQLGMDGDAYDTMMRAIDTKFLNERRKRIEDENAQTAQIVAEAGTSGLTGFAKFDAERLEKMAALQRESAKFADSGTYNKRKASIDQGSAAEAMQLQTQFNDRIAQLDAARSDRYESESGKVKSSADRTVAEITRAWAEMYGHLGPMDQRYAQGYQALQTEVAKIHADAARQQYEVSQRIEDETRKLEREGARVGMPREREETQAILDAYTDRYNRLEELRLNDAANADKYRRQELAEEAIKNGKLLDQRRAMRDRLAGELQGLFTNPLEALKRQGEQMASKLAASAILKLAHPAPGTLGTGGKQGGGLFGLPESWMDVGGFTHRQRGAGIPGMAPRPGGTFSATPTGDTTLHAATATIHVTSATITGLGGGAGFRNASFSGPELKRRVPMFTEQPTGDVPAAGGGFSESVGPGSSTGVPSFSGSSTREAGSGSAMSTIGTYQDSQRMPSSVSSAIGGVQQMAGMRGSVDQLGKELGAHGSILGKIPGMGALGKLAGNAKVQGGLGGALGLFSAFESGGGFGGALQGTLAGAQFGSQFGGPIGAAIGGAAGLVMGFLGFGARQKAAKYDRETVRPQIAGDLRGFEAGTMDYQSAYDDFDKLSRDAKIQTRQFGSGAKGYYNDTIKPEIEAAQARLTREQKAGRSQFGFSAAQFHTGGRITGFGDLGTSATEGFIHAMLNERVINPMASATHAPALDAINSGASHSDMAAYYGGNAGTAPVAPSPADVNLHFHSADAKGARELLMANKHHVRAALNESYGENSGGYDFV